MIVSSVTILLLVEAPYGYAQSENLTQSQSENLTQVVIQTVSKIQQCSLTALAQHSGMALMDEATGETLNLISQTISSSCNEVNFIFPTPNVAKRFMLEGLFSSATYNVKNRIQLRILIKEDKSSIDSCLVEKLPFAVGR